MPFVLDASIAGAWFLPNEDPRAVAVLDRIDTEVALVTTLFRHEMRHLLLSAERGKRLDNRQVDEAMSMLASLDLTERPVRDEREVLDLARKHGLSGYDASYLALAIAEKLPLATFDKQLRAAGPAAGVEILPS